MAVPGSGKLWLRWAISCAFGGFSCAISESLFVRDAFSVHGAIAAVVGATVGGLTYQLCRGGPPRFGGIAIIMGGGMSGVKSESVLLALAIGVIVGIPMGFLARLLGTHRQRITNVRLNERRPAAPPRSSHGANTTNDRDGGSGIRYGPDAVRLQSRPSLSSRRIAPDCVVKSTRRPRSNAFASPRRRLSPGRSSPL